MQALRYTPWIALRQSSGRDGYDLDYTQMLPPAILLHSFKKRHFVIFLTTDLTALLKVQIVLSTALFQLKSVETRRPVMVEALDSSAVPERWPNDATIYQLTKAFQDLNMAYPFGVNAKSAYQTFRIQEQSHSGANALERGRAGCGFRRN